MQPENEQEKVSDLSPNTSQQPFESRKPKGIIQPLNQDIVPEPLAVKQPAQPTSNELAADAYVSPSEGPREQYPGSTNRTPFTNIVQQQPKNDELEAWQIKSSRKNARMIHFYAVICLLVGVAYGAISTYQAIRSLNTTLAEVSSQFIMSYMLLSFLGPVIFTLLGILLFIKKPSSRKIAKSLCTVIFIYGLFTAIFQIPQVVLRAVLMPLGLMLLFLASSAVLLGIFLLLPYKINKQLNTTSSEAMFSKKIPTAKPL